MEKKKRRLGDRRDGMLLRDLDSMHYIVPLLYPNRCDNEAFISERIDLTNLSAFLAEKNQDQPQYPLKLFYIIVAALGRTLTLRPKMNRFIANKNIYQRNELTAAFVVKKEFSDNGGEGLAKVRFEETDTLDSIHQKIVKQITANRGSQVDGSTESMDVLNKMPRLLSKFLVWIITRLDIHGRVPKFLIETDPYYCSVVLTNLGSIKLHAGYHHLTNWGTNSIFVAVGQRKMRPFFQEDGSVEMRDSLDLGLTIDERIADGYYYSKTVQLLKTLLENPALLEQPLSAPLDDLEKAK